MSADTDQLERDHAAQRARAQAEQDELFGFDPVGDEVRIRLTKPHAKSLDLQPGKKAKLYVIIDENGNMCIDRIKHLN